MTVRTYPSPEAFKQARLRTSARTGAQFARKRQLLVFDRCFRKTHVLPPAFPDPLLFWATPYAAMAHEDQLPWPTLDDVTAAVRAFFDPVLVGHELSQWNPKARSWSS
jgi:hypothetical protein